MTPLTRSTSAERSFGRIGLFTDVDKTLTEDYVQRTYARALGVEDKYLEIESDFQKGLLDEVAFGRRIVILFRQAGFTRELAESFACQVNLEIRWDEIFHLPVELYLVSSGPSYYLRSLARSHPKLRGHFIGSEYSFEPESGLIVDCRATTAEMKAEFVRQHVTRHYLSIGLGDSEAFDGPFLRHCSIPIVLDVEQQYGESGSLNEPFFHIRSIRVISTLVEQLRQAQKRILRAEL